MASSAKQARSGDGRFDFSQSAALPKERPVVLGTEMVVFEPTPKIDKDTLPSLIEYDIYSTRPLLTGPLSRFRVKGSFEMQKPVAAGQVAKWIPCPDTEWKNVILQPNWFEHLIKSYEIFYNHNRITTFNEARGVQPVLNSYLYHYMDESMKKTIFPEPCHPAWCTPDKKDSWAAGEETNKTWEDYAKHVFTGKIIQFEWSGPALAWPLWQAPTHWTDPSVPSKVLPLPLFGHIQARIYMVDDSSVIFRIAAQNTSKYRFRLHNMSLVMEEARLPNGAERQLYMSKRSLTYPGVTRLQLVETMQTSTMNYRCRFQDIYLPEALLIFAVNKNVPSGNLAFSTDTSNNVFMPHNISSVDVSFDSKQFQMKDIGIGTVSDDIIDVKSLFDHWHCPPMGIPVNKEKLTLKEVKEGGAKSAYPHVYIPLTPWFSKRTRLVPQFDEGSVIGKKANLDLNIKFKATASGSVENGAYIIYAIYSDQSVTFETSTRSFTTPYGGVTLTHQH